MTKQMKIRFYKSNNLMRKHFRKPGRKNVSPRSPFQKEQKV